MHKINNNAQVILTDEDIYFGLFSLVFYLDLYYVFALAQAFFILLWACVMFWAGPSPISLFVYYIYTCCMDRDWWNELKAMGFSTALFFLLLFSPSSFFLVSISHLLTVSNYFMLHQLGIRAKTGFHNQSASHNTCISQILHLHTVSIYSTQLLLLHSIDHHPAAQQYSNQQVCLQKKLPKTTRTPTHGNCSIHFIQKLGTTLESQSPVITLYLL